MDSQADLLDRVVADLGDPWGSDVVAKLSDAERVELLRKLGTVHRRVEALIVETIASADQGLGMAFGCRSTNELVQRALRTDAAGGARVVKASKLVRRETELTSGAPLPGRWPALREALRDGTIGVAGLLAATGPLEHAGPRIGAEDRLRADAELAAYARGTMGGEPGDDVVPGPAPTPEDLRVLAQVIVAYLDPDGAT